MFPVSINCLVSQSLFVSWGAEFRLVLVLELL